MTNKVNEPYTKDSLRAVLRMKRSKFITHMKTLESELMIKFPRYNKKCSIVPDGVFKWICDDYGLNTETVIERMIIYYGIENPTDIKQIYATFGVSQISFLNDLNRL